jgi:hypothetical protein
MGSDRGSVKADTASTGGGQTLSDAFVVLVLCLVLVPALLLTTYAPVIALAVGAGMAYIAIRWPISAGPVPRIVSGLVAIVALLAAFIGFAS